MPEYLHTRLRGSRSWSGSPSRRAAPVVVGLCLLVVDDCQRVADWLFFPFFLGAVSPPVHPGLCVV